MGEVYAAEGTGGEKVALKVLHERAAQDPDLVARFQREATIADADQVALRRRRSSAPARSGTAASGSPSSGSIGEGLDERLRREQYLSFAEVAPIVDDALQGLDAAHGARRHPSRHQAGEPLHREAQAHRRRDRRGRARGAHAHPRLRRLEDEVERAARKSEPSLTAFDATLGSFAYMAPEQVRGSARVDERADLYALGAVAFRALTGRLPFEGHERAHAHRAQARSRAADARGDDGRRVARVDRAVPREDHGARAREARYAQRHGSARGVAQGLPRDGQRRRSIGAPHEPRRPRRVAARRPHRGDGPDVHRRHVLRRSLKTTAAPSEERHGRFPSYGARSVADAAAVLARVRAVAARPRRDAFSRWYSRHAIDGVVAALPGEPAAASPPAAPLQYVVASVETPR